MRENIDLTFDEYLKINDTKIAEIKSAMKKAGFDGPWMTEPDRLEFKHAGFDCLLVRHTTMFQWCGYVGVPKEHSAYKKDYNEVKVDVHGGLTYADLCHGIICHKSDREKEPVWWLGFDCAHFGDTMPATDFLLSKLLLDIKPPIRSLSSYKDIAYVKKETERLADQLSIL